MNPLDEIGLELEQVAATAYRAFQLSAGQDPDGEVHPAWNRVAIHVVSLAEAGDGEDVQLSLAQLARMLRNEFARAASDGDDDVPPWDQVPAVARVAWEAVARHLLNVMSGEISRQLGQHEGAIADWAKAKLAAA